MESRPVSGIPAPTSPIPVLTSNPNDQAPASIPQQTANLPFSEFSARMEAAVLEPESGEIATVFALDNAKPQDLPEIHRLLRFKQ